MIKAQQGCDVDRVGVYPGPVQPLFEIANQRSSLGMVAHHGHGLGRTRLLEFQTLPPVANQQTLQLGVLALAERARHRRVDQGLDTVGQRHRAGGLFLRRDRLAAAEQKDRRQPRHQSEPPIAMSKR